jgi:hypothetical protein
MSNLQIKGKFILDDTIDGKKILLNAPGTGTEGSDAIRVANPNHDPEIPGSVASFDLISVDPVTGKPLALADISTGQTKEIALLVDGKIPSSLLPKLAITDVYAVADITARDQLTVQEGDVVVVASVETSSGSGVFIPKTYIYKQPNSVEGETGESGSAEWLEIQASGGVVSVNGETGVVTLTADDIDLGMVDVGGVPTQLQIRNKSDLQEVLVQLDSDLGSAEQAVTDLVTLSGVAPNSQNLGTFAGSVIRDNAKVKEALEDLENAVEGHRKQKFVLTQTDLNNGYVELATLAKENSIVASVGRLMIHEAAKVEGQALSSYADDFYTELNPGGTATRIVFAGNLVTPGQEQLSAGIGGDTIYVKYMANTKAPL